MGSSLVPVLANIFMGFHESKLLNEYNLNKIKFYSRKNKLTIPSLLLMYSFHLSIINYHTSNISWIDLYKTYLKFWKFYLIFI